ncbi:MULTISPECIES: hypothetical protein [unclassified Streptomyces]|uniref:hypothetical protein n=1 Tax=Streptomyces sp. NPDC055082 TaxID=3365718 RepID=UPI0037D22529
MRPSRDSEGKSPTPIYDALYSEYRRSFRALPGDRSGEENLGFSSFGTGLFGVRPPLGHSATGGHHGGYGSQGGQGGTPRTGSLGSWQRVGRHAGRAQPALPPGPASREY